MAEERDDKRAFVSKLSALRGCDDTLVVNHLRYDQIGDGEPLRDYAFILHQINAADRCMVFALPGDVTGGIYMFVGHMTHKGETSSFKLYGIPDASMVLDEATRCLDPIRLRRLLRGKYRGDYLLKTEHSRYTVLAIAPRFTVRGEVIRHEFQLYPSMPRARVAVSRHGYKERRRRPRRL